jgi:hypothetical protein
MLLELVHRKRRRDSMFDINAQIVFPQTSWDFAVLVGEAVSWVQNGYPDAYDALDYQDYAREVYQDSLDGCSFRTYREMFLDMKAYQEWLPEGVEVAL